MGHTYAKLRQMSKDELIEVYDQKAEHVDLTVALCLQEIARRDLEEHSQRILTMTTDMHGWTQVVKGLTVVITILTGVNVLLVALQFWWSVRP